MKLKGKRVALFVEKLYNEHEFWYPYYRFKEEGAEVKVVAPNIEIFHGKYGNLPVKPELTSKEIDTKDFDAVFIPGGYCPDYLRAHKSVTDFVRKMYEEGKLVASICHGAWVLISAGITKGKKITSTITIKDDVINSGAEFVDKEVVVDGNIITSRTPDDLPYMLPEIIKKLSD